MCFPRIVLGKCLISVALNRRHLTEGQKAVLANEYRKILSEKAKKQRAVNAIEKRWRPEQKYLSETVTGKYNEGQKAVLANNYREILSRKAKEQRAKIAVTQREINRGNISEETVSSKMDKEERSRKIAAERWKVSEWKVRIAHEIEMETINIKWHSDNSSVEETVSTSDKDEVSDTKKAINVR